jgi:exosortase/archaeosortase family protein
MLSTLEKERKLTEIFSYKMCFASILCFLAASWLNVFHHWQVIATIAFSGTTCGLFVFVPCSEFLGMARRRRKLSMIALIAASSCFLYNMFDYYLFESLCKSSGLFIYWVMHGLGFEVGVSLGDGKNVTLSSPYFTIQVHRSCSGIEGMFLFQFLLSSIILIDWPVFESSSLIEFYLAGFIYMFAVNCLRIASIFSLGYFASKPDASQFMKSLRGLPIKMFHSFAGEIYYLIAFVIFASLLYKFCLKSVQGDYHTVVPTE